MKYGLIYAFAFLLLVGVVSAANNVSCAKVGEQYSIVFTDEYPSKCCAGLTEWEAGMDTRSVENGTCVSHPSLVSGWPVGRCLACGDGVCDGSENICNCAEDCSADIISHDGKSLYWIDNENKDCGQKEFWGAYMYYGLQTFESKKECERVAQGIMCPDIALPADGWCNGLIVDGGVDSSGCDMPPKCEKAANEKICGVWKTSGCSLENCSGDWQFHTFLNKAEMRNYNAIYVHNGPCAEGENYDVKIKIMPETASERAIERLGDLNFTIELKEVGVNRTAYEVVGEKQGKMLGLFKVKANVSMQVDAETGEVKVHRPWWAFLASGI